MTLLPKETVVMRDPIVVNYWLEYSFKNIECIAHLLRDLQKVHDYTQHNWALELKNHISNQMHKRNQLIEEGKEQFSDIEIIKDFFRELNEIISKETKESEETNPIIEICSENGINEIDVFVHLCTDEPYSTCFVCFFRTDVNSN